MTDQGCDIGMVGLGVMGQNLALNIADHDFSAVGFDRDSEKTKELVSRATGGSRVFGVSSLQELTGRLKRPRVIIVLVPAGPPVDAVIEGLLPYLEPADLVIDSGNSHFRDTDRRLKSLAEKGLLFVGMGVSGGEEGARYGPSMMPGGPKSLKRARSALSSSELAVTSACSRVQPASVCCTRASEKVCRSISLHDTHQSA